MKSVMLRSGGRMSCSEARRTKLGDFTQSYWQFYDSFCASLRKLILKSVLIRH
jgi:hypothetical protein